MMPGLTEATAFSLMLRSRRWHMGVELFVCQSFIFCCPIAIQYHGKVDFMPSTATSVCFQ